MGAPSRSRVVGIGTVLLAASAWATWPLYVRETPITGLQLGMITMIVMALPMPWALGELKRASRQATAALVIVGIADAANVVFYFSALSRGPIATAVLTHYLAPVIVSLSAPIFVGEARSTRALLALPAFLGGLWLVLSAQGGFSLSVTAVYGTASAVCYATNVLASRVAARSYSSLAIVALHAVVGIFALWAFGGNAVLPPAGIDGLTLIIVGAIINSLIAAVLFNVGLRRIGAQLTGALTYAEPLGASFIGWVVLHDQVTPWAIAGAALVLAAGVWVALEKQ